MIATRDSRHIAPYPIERTPGPRVRDLGRDAAGDERVKSADRAAGDGDETKGKTLPGTTGPEPSTNDVNAGM